MMEAITPSNPSAKKKDLKRIFFGFALIFLAVFSAAAALYWPEFQKQFFPEMTVSAQKIVPFRSETKRNGTEPTTSASETKVAVAKKKSAPQEGFLWVDQASLQYIVTLGKAQGVSDAKRLKVYDGTDLLGQVVVSRALETVSYVVPEKSVDISKDAYYRVVAE